MSDPKTSEPAPQSEEADRAAVEGLFYAYADALDRRAWGDLDEVFDPEVTVDYAGQYTIAGRPGVVAMIRSYLDPVGPTQHLMANPRVKVEGDRARASIKMRVHHVGAGERSSLTYECFGWYYAEATRGSQGWRVVSWRQEVTHQLGTMDVFVDPMAPTTGG